MNRLATVDFSINGNALRLTEKFRNVPLANQSEGIFASFILIDHAQRWLHLARCIASRYLYVMTVAREGKFNGTFSSIDTISQELSLIFLYYINLFFI